MFSGLMSLGKVMSMTRMEVGKGNTRVDEVTVIVQKGEAREDLGCN